MIDLPFPSIIQGDTEKQIEDIHQYLTRLRDELEHTIGNLTTENFSSDLNAQFETIQQMVNSAVENSDSARLAAAKTLTVHDVVGSSLFENKITEVKTYADGVGNGAKAYADNVLKYTDVTIGSITFSSYRASISSYKPVIDGTLLFVQPLHYSGGNGAISADADGEYLHGSGTVTDLSLRYFYK